MVYVNFEPVEGVACHVHNYNAMADIDPDSLLFQEALVNDQIGEVRRLIEGGANVNGKGPSGRRPLDFTTDLGPCYEEPERMCSRCMYRVRGVLGRVSLQSHLRDTS